MKVRPITLCFSILYRMAWKKRRKRNEFNLKEMEIFLESREDTLI